MFAIKRLDDIKKKKPTLNHAGIFVLKIGSILELLIIVLFWLLLFTRYQELFGLTREEIITYILVGNILGLAANFIWARIIARDIKSTESKLLILKPIKYFEYILKRAFGKFFPTFIFVVGLNLILLQVFIGSFPVNLNPLILIVIFLMVILAFIIEFLIAYLLNLFIFWTIESVDIYRVLIRTKKLLAGAYFPLTLLPLALLQISLFLPFAYSFFVPTALYLKKLDLSYGIFGLGVQAAWIIVLYTVIKFVWDKKQSHDTK